MSIPVIVLAPLHAGGHGPMREADRFEVHRLMTAMQNIFGTIPSIN